MAAYASVVSVTNIMENIQTHPRHSFSFDYNQFKSLREIVDFLVDFLESYSHGGGKEAENLESQITSAARKAEDVIESHVVDQIHAGTTLSEETSSCFLEDLQNVIEEMDSVKELAMKVKVRRGYGDQQPADSRPTTSTRALTTGENAMVGFDDELIQLMERLTAQQPNRQIIPIVGMGGIGKTTLATNVYEHLHIVQYFDVRFWATVSQRYSAKEILSELLGGNESTCETVYELGERLHKTLSGKRYLVVLDDMWSIDAWDEIQMFFPDNGNGSRVVITSRQRTLATHLCSSNFVMKFLDGNKSWELLCEKVFGGEGCPLDLEEIGKRIVRNCKGLPLLIVVIGGHLRKSSRTKEYWEEVANDTHSILNSGEDEQCLKILSLSYSYLPVYLKPCFLYLGIFSEDQAIRTTALIRLWIAEGFLKPNEARSLDEVGESYIRDLADRNLIIVRRRACTGDTNSCNVHDLLRELCVRVAEQDNFFSILDNYNTRELCTGAAENENFFSRLDNYTTRAIHARRIVIHEAIYPNEESNPEIFDALRSAQLVRSLLWRGGVLSFNLRLLRVLEQADLPNDREDVSPSLDAQFQQVNLNYIQPQTYDGACVLPSLDAQFQDVNFNYSYTRYPPPSVSRDFQFQQVNLKYIHYRIYCHGTLYLPPSISRLWNLQTLIITQSWGGSFRIFLPPEIWEMPQLRHVAIRHFCLPDPPPGDILDQQNRFVLRNLQTLSSVENFRMTEEVCNRVPNIKILTVRYSDFRGEGESISHYCPHNIGRFRKLDSLFLHFSITKNWRIFALSFTFPGSLSELILRGCRLLWEDLTVIGSLPLLKTLILGRDSVVGPEWNSVEGQFRSLKCLRIKSCKDLIRWNTERSHFPILKTLFLENTVALHEIPSDIGEIPTLELIMSHNCSVSVAFSALKILVEQEELGNDGLRLQVTFSKTVQERSFREMMEVEGLTSNNVRVNVKK